MKQNINENNIKTWNSRISCRSLKCARITIHMNLFISFAANNLLWVLWYRLVIAQTEVTRESPVSKFFYFPLLPPTLTFIWSICSPFVWRRIKAFWCKKYKHRPTKEKNETDKVGTNDELLMKSFTNEWHSRVPRIAGAVSMNFALKRNMKENMVINVSHPIFYAKEIVP